MSGDLNGRIDAVVEGAGGRLFLDRAAGFDAARYATPFAAADTLERLWGPPLDRLSRLADEIGARLVLLIAPDAHGVHADELPRGRAYAEPSMSDALATLARARGVATVHPRQTLRRAQGPVEVFRRTDSHWSAFGAWLAYSDLMRELAPCGAVAVEADAFDFGWRAEAGDLGALHDPPRRGLAPTPAMHAPRARVAFDAINERRHALRVTETPDAGAPCAVMLRDSYAGELAPFLSESFRRLVMVGADNLLFEDLIREERPQAIILERGERTLPFGLVDPPPFVGWREHWPAPGEGDAEPVAREAEFDAMRLLAAGQAAEAVTAAESAMLAAVTPDRLALVGRARDAAGRPDGVDGFEAAHALDPERPGLMLELGAAHLRHGRDAEARDLFARACILRPWSGEAYEHLGYAALRTQEFELARYALERAVAVAPHRAGGWLWLGEWHAARGDGAAALAVFAQGLCASPADPALIAAAARFTAAA